MASRLAVATFRWVIAATGAVALADAIIVAQTSSGSAATADFLSSVTALTNILSVVVFAVAGADARRSGAQATAPGLRRGAHGARTADVRARRGARIALVRALNVATLVSMSVLFVGIYGPVVVTDPAQLNATSVVLHLVIPILAVVDWFVFPAERRAPVRGVFLVLVFPCVWFVYSFVRGALTRRYVYEFLDPSGPSGVEGVAAMTVLIISSFFLVGAAVFSFQRSREKSPPPRRWSDIHSS